MDVALVCIAKNEDNYIQEWIDYHLKLGFNDIHIFQNDWRFEKQIPNEHVYFHEYDGRCYDAAEIISNCISENALPVLTVLDFLNMELNRQVDFVSSFGMLEHIYGQSSRDLIIKKMNAKFCILVWTKYKLGLIFNYFF